MNIQRATPVNEFLAKLIFLLLPTAGVGYYLLYTLNDQYAILQNQAWLQSLYFAAGMGIAALIYSFRIRFVPTYAVLLFLLYSTYKGIDAFATSEFSFYVSLRFQVFALLFSMGWLIGWGYIRLRYFAVILSGVLLASCISVIAMAKVDTVEALLYAFVPAMLYSVYNVFTTEQIYNYKDKNSKFWWFLIRRLLLFVLVAGVIMGIVIWFMRDEIKATVANYGGGGKKGESNSLLHKQDTPGQQGFTMDSLMKLSSSFNRDKQLLFCAHIDNYFPGSKEPNPLYLTEGYYTLFDTATETFERDKNIPSNDLFSPDPGKIPLFGTKVDTTVIRNSKATLARNIVDAEIYNVAMTPGTYLAPNVGFFVQPITIEKEFRDKFRSAYRTKSYVSALNSAYFVYNIDTGVIREFQQMRFGVLRQVKDYKGTDSVFMKYYTKMPGGDKFRSITALAHKVTDKAQTPVDKVIAIRDYFLSKDENGDHLYKYTDNPGEPDIPNASKLLYFLNENHKGYCAYYAGATLFMLRSIGIPSRIVVGFLTEDRGDKNKGWYWYYANQAHAWVQVYFPGYGWLDFDTTVGNTDENRPTPQPDGTPPMQPPKAWLAAEGVVENIDTLKKLVQFRVSHYVFHDKEYNPEKPVSLSMDMKVAVFYKDSVVLPISQVRPGDSGTAVSYAEALKKIEPSENENATSLIKGLHAPIPMDEVYLMSREVIAKKQAEAKQEEPQKDNNNALYISLSIAAFLLLLALYSPRLLLWYYLYRYKTSRADKDKPYWAYRTATYYLHMIGVEKGTATPMQYARNVVDPAYGTGFVPFMNVYLKQKYGQQPLNEREQAIVAGFLQPFLQTVRRQTKWFTRKLAFRNPVRMASFFTMPEEDQKEV